jgi:benzodiazapine receptor
MDYREEFYAWYSNLIRPAWTPPSWVFGPVWSVLYTLMAIALILVIINRANHEITFPVILFIIQLSLNAGWVGIFFGLHQIGFAFLEILFLWTVILFTVIAFWKVSQLGAVLLLPYLFWVSFAAVLNFSLWRLNP